MSEQDLSSESKDSKPQEQGSPEDKICPKCGRSLVLRHSQRGDFLGCSGFPECDYMRPVGVRHTVETLELLDKPCPKCGEPLAVKKGRFGMFIGCSAYPLCDYTFRDSEDEGVPCPVCRKGTLQKRSTASGRAFYACSNYPECRFSLPGKPVAKTCECCAFPVMYEKPGKSGIKLVCGNTMCDSRRHRRRIKRSRGDLSDAADMLKLQDKFAQDDISEE